ncbi:MAG: BamA/TamA family outer membrane protein, partial [Limisphaerales bacterium]
LFNPPTFTGAGEQARLHIQLGYEDQEYDLSFVDPWFLNRKLALGVDLYRDSWYFESPNNVFNETRTGARVSLTRALFNSDFWRGTIFYNIEDIGISLNSGWYGPEASQGGPPPVAGQIGVQNVPNAIVQQVGDHVFNRFGASLIWDKRNNPAGLSNHGWLAELDPELSVGDQTFYKIEAKTSVFFPGLFRGHVIEVDGHIGTEKAITGGDVPFYDRYFLGGEYDLRGFQYRNIAPREGNPGYPGTFFEEPVGGDSFVWGSVEYSLPIIEKAGSFSLRFALFFDIGSVGEGPYTFGGNFDDDWGPGIRLNIPRLGPLRLDYGIPITHDKYNSSKGQFQPSFGYQRQF